MTEDTSVGPEERRFSAGAAISNQIVGLFSRYIGRGPTRARTILNTNIAVVTMGETMTKAEENLVAAGEAEAVRATRRTLQRAMRDEAAAAVEEIVGRRVVAYMADLDTEADMAIVAFVLEPRGEGGHGEAAGGDHAGTM